MLCVIAFANRKLMRHQSDDEIYNYWVIELREQNDKFNRLNTIPSELRLNRFI